MIELTTPAMSTGFRWHDPNAGLPTGARAVHDIYAINQSTGNAADYTTVPSGTFATCLFRDPLRATVTFWANKLGKNKQYNSVHWNGTSQVAALPIPSTTSQETPISFVYANDQTGGTWAPHGPQMYAGTTLLNPSLDLIWLDNTDVIAFSQSTSETADHIVPYIYTPSGIVRGVPIVFSSSTASFNAATNALASPLGAYYTFGYANGSGVANAVSFSVVGTGDSWAHRPIPGVNLHPNSLVQVRVLAASTLLTNCASAVYAEGQLYAAQFPMIEQWYTKLTSQTLTACSVKYVGQLATGMYSWLKPSTAQDLSYRPAFELTNGVISGTNYWIDETTTMIVVMATSVAANTGAYPGLDLIISSDFAIEYQTEDVWDEIEYPEITAVQSMAVLDKVKYYDVFHENPLHMDDLRRYLSTAGSFVKKHAGKIGGALSALFPQHAAWIGLGARALSR